MPIRVRISFCFLIFLAVSACGQNRRPGLSDRDLFAQRTVETLQQAEQEPELDFSDMETYVVPAGIRYKESRAIDPANPPVVIDIEAALYQGEEDILLSGIGKTVKYIRANLPKDMNILDYVIRDDTLFISCRNQDTNIQGVVPYSLDGNFLNIIWEVTPDGIAKKYHPDIEEEAMPPQTSGTTSRPIPSFPTWDEGSEIIFNINFDHTGKDIHYTITRWLDPEHPEYNKHIISRLNGTRRAVSSKRFGDAPHNSYYMPSVGWFHVYRTLDQWFNKSPWSLITFSSYGDTLCRFANHNPVTPVNVTARSVRERVNAYFYNERLTFRNDYSDTIFRVAAPNRIIPAYAINCGKYKLFASEGLRNQTENKVYIENIRETQRFLFISINTPTRERQVLLFDKQQQTLRRHIKANLSNDIDYGPEFYPEKIMPDGETMACYFRSNYFQDNPSDVINSLFPSMAQNSVIFMILE